MVWAEGCELRIAQSDSFLAFIMLSFHYQLDQNQLSVP